MDTIEMGSPVPPWLRSLRVRVGALVAVALIVGAVAGYVLAPARAGQPTTAPIGAEPTARLLVPGGGQPPTVTGNRCSVQLGRTLQLGLEIVNTSAVGATLLRADVGLPLDGLRLTATAWGSCGQLMSMDGADPHPLAPGATTWLTMTFDVLTPCPAPLPVQVDLTYSRGGTDAVTSLGGFSDLGDVPYTGCTTSPS